MQAIKRIIIVGQGASGKDYFAESLIKQGYKFPISYTTRPPRKNEIDGVNYRFVSEEDFKSLIENDSLYEYVEYPNRGKFSNETWYYGRIKEDFYDGDVMIMTPAGIYQLSNEDRDSSYIIYLNIPEDIRRKRMNKRVDADDTERRLKTDKEDFENFNEYDYVCKNPEFIPSNIQMMIEKGLGFFPKKRNKIEL